MKRSFFTILVAVIAFTGGLSVRWLMSAPANPAEPVNQQSFRDFSLTDLDGNLHSTKEWQGKVMIINFWATWCPPCLKEMPAFSGLQKEFGPKGLQFIGVAIDEAESVKDFFQRTPINYPVLLGENQGTKIAHDLGNIVNTVPFTVIVDKQGHIVKSHMGELPREKLLEIVKPLL